MAAGKRQSPVIAATVKPFDLSAEKLIAELAASVTSLHVLSIPHSSYAPARLRRLTQSLRD